MSEQLREMEIREDRIARGWMRTKRDLDRMKASIKLCEKKLTLQEKALKAAQGELYREQRKNMRK